MERTHYPDVDAEVPRGQCSPKLGELETSARLHRAESQSVTPSELPLWVEPVQVSGVGGARTFQR